MRYLKMGIAYAGTLGAIVFLPLIFGKTTVKVNEGHDKAFDVLNVAYAETPDPGGGGGSCAGCCGAGGGGGGGGDGGAGGASGGDGGAGGACCGCDGCGAGCASGCCCT